MSIESTAPGASARARNRILLAVVGLSLVVAAVLPGAAGAANIFTLDTNPASGASAPVAVDSAGTGYFAWEHNGGSAQDEAMFCKVPRGGTCASPIVLPTAPAISGQTHVDGAFPVLGSGSTVYVVGPRFIEQDVVVWTSTDGGSSFAAVTRFPSGVSAGSDPTDVLAAPSGGFYVSSHNPGLDFTSVPASGAGTAPVTDLSPPGGTSNVIGDSTLGLAGGGATGNPVEAWSMFTSGQPSTVNFRSYSGTGNLDSAGSWNAPSQVTTGKLSSLAGGPSGLFLASEDIDAAGHYTQVNVRKYTGAGFGTPVATLQGDTSDVNAGRIFQTPGGRLLVAWPGPTPANGVTPIRLYDSTNGSAPFTSVGDVADGTPFNAIYPASIRAAAADDGLGYVSFNEYGGGSTFLRVADFTPIKSATATVTTLTTAGQAAAAKLTVGPGTPVTDTATIQGPAGTTATGATGTVAYTVYSDAACKTLVRTGGTTAVSGGKGAASLPISLSVGTWYYLAQYSGDAAYLASTSACGAEVVTVAPASVGVAGIIFVGGNIVINAGFNTRGTLLVTSQVTNASQVLIPPGPPLHAMLASAAKKKNRCKTGQVLLKVGKQNKCVSNSFGTTTKTISAPGAYTIKLAPNAAALRALKNGKTLHVKVTLTFKPAAAGKPVVRSRTITVKRKKH
jgi:hypothetical protein